MAYALAARVLGLPNITAGSAVLLAGHTNGRSYATVLRLLSVVVFSVVCTECTVRCVQCTVVFNANKSECLVMQPRQHRFSPTLKLDFHVGHW